MIQFYRGKIAVIKISLAWVTKTNRWKDYCLISVCIFFFHFQTYVYAFGCFNVTTYLSCELLEKVTLCNDLKHPKSKRKLIHGNE